MKIGSIRGTDVLEFASYLTFNASVDGGTIVISDYLRIQKRFSCLTLAVLPVGWVEVGYVS